jgi:hypothetical protein
MSNPASVLYQPGTEFARSMNGVNAVWAAGMTNNASPFGPNGVGNPMSNALPGIGGTSSYNPSRGPDLGAFTQTNFHLCVDFTKFEQHRSSAKQLVFTSRASNGSTHDMKGWSSMNQYLRSEEGMNKYGSERTPWKLTEDWSFYGAPVSNTTAELRDTDEKCQAFHIAKRARVYNVAIAISNKSRCAMPEVAQGDHVYGILRRYAEKDEIEAVFRAVGSRVGSVGSAAPATSNKHYWQLEPYISHNRVPPHPLLYQNATGSGMPIFIGSVWTVYGDPYVQHESVNVGRRALHPTHDTSEYLNDIKKGFEIDINIGVR